MTTLRVPYETAEEIGVFLDLEVPDQNLVRSFVPQEAPALPNLAEAMAYAIEHPLGCKPLSQLVRKGDKVVILTENQFRAAPSAPVLPGLIRSIQAAGGIVRIAIGNGKVPALSPEEIEEKLGKEVVSMGIPITCNDVSDPGKYTFLDITSRGVPVFVLNEVAEADVKISISTTQATLWGYGGSGMIIPAISGNETIEMNHMFSLPADCRPGNNGCHMQEDKYEAARMAGLDMGIQMIVNNKFEVTYLQAGEFVQAHKATVTAYDKVYRFNAAEFAGAPADIVITGSSAPTNHLYFHTGWAAVNVDPIVKDGGTIIHATPCPGYHSWPGFALMDLMSDYLPPSTGNIAKAMRAFYAKDRELWAGCIWWKIYEVMTRKNIVVVTDAGNIEAAKGVGLGASTSLDGAFKDALDRHGKNARVAFVPYGRYSVLDV